MNDSIFRNIVNNLSTGMMIFDSDNNLIHSNNFAENIFTEYFSEFIVINLSDLFEAIEVEMVDVTDMISDSYTVIKKETTLVFTVFSINDDESYRYTAVKIVNISGQKRSMQKQEKHATDLLWKTRSKLTNLINALEIISSGMDIDDGTKNEIFCSSKIELFQIGRIVDNFRELTLINSNLLQESLELEKFNLSDVVNEAIRNFNIYTMSIQKKFSLLNKCLGESEIFADRYRMLKIIESLLLNAFIYADNNVEINIELVKNVQAVKLIISDTGWGIKDEDQKNIFSYTFRGENAKRSDHQGVGSELFICRQILTKMNSEITFNSKEGEGSEFIIAFPNSATGIYYL